MIIGIDIDDTITNTRDYIESYIINNPQEFSNPKELLNTLREVVQRRRRLEEITPEIKKLYTSMAKNVELYSNVKESIDKLKDMGHKIIFITTRSHRFFGETVEEQTIEYLNRHNIYFDKLIARAGEKLDQCIENKIDLLIDDSVTICESVSKAGIKVYLYTSLLNKDNDTSIERVNNWTEIVEKVKEL